MLRWRVNGNGNGNRANGTVLLPTVPRTPGALTDVTTEVPAARRGGRCSKKDLPPLLVASDIDGTLLLRDRVAAPEVGDSRMIAALLTLATGRPARWLQPVLEQLPVRPVCVWATAPCCRPGRDVVLADHSRHPTQAEVVAIARSAMADVGPVGVAVERAGRSALDPSDEPFVVGPAYAHAWEPRVRHLRGNRDDVRAGDENAAHASAELHSIIAPHIPADPRT